MPMSPRLLRPIASGFHPEAQVWRNAVIANGGTVSGTTFKAVSDFCRSIDAAGLRDRFLRLNLLCGTSDASLNAVRTPLYRGPSRTGTQHGLTIDTNVNFVEGDYAETGASGGLKNSSTNHLLAGDMSAMTANNAHAMAYGIDLTSGAGDRFLLGAGGASFAGLYAIQMGGLSHRAYINATGGPGLVVSATTPTSGMVTVSSTSATNLNLYSNNAVNGTEATGSRGTSALASVSMAIFGYNNNGTVDRNSQARLRAYSVGFGMSAAQVSSYYTIMQAFQTALGRAA
jgi:hypothetical protein